jgi:glucoamylase
MKIISFFTVFFMGVSVVQADDLDQWLESQRHLSERKILAHISPANARPGAVIASPSKYDPDYYYHWVRDAALVMDIWMRQLEGSTSMSLPRQHLEDLIWDFASFTNYSQSLADVVGYVGLGEPRYYVDGTPNLLPWGRPQNDGPALRASLFIRFANYLIKTNRENIARKLLWPVIVKDLQYTGDQVYAIGFDLWEEVEGDHFYTRVTCREALLLGAELAARFDDPAGSAWLSAQAKVAESLAFAHFDESRGQVTENTNRRELHRDKSSGLDVGTVLALLHTTRKPIVEFSHPLILQTMNKLEGKFQEIYHINKAFSDLGTAIGRYPEDHYYGGNPWFLATFAYAEYYYKLGDRAKGDRYMRRARFHAARDGHMSEQMSRDNGYMLSAADLTWSYAAFITAYEARRQFTSGNK